MTQKRTPTPAELEETIASYQNTIAPYADTIERNPRGTIVPELLAPNTAGRRALALLREQAGGAGSKLELEETLGEGGMGIVHLATQTSVGRKVAVKTLRPEHQSTSAVIKLLREAWLTGSLEHPNVLPVYEVSMDGEGHPLVVLKRIEGVEWGRLMRDTERLKQLFGAQDPLQNNLSIVMQICRALSFAHSRGIIHRDVKPENVMIGEFGEVYLLDWGIAVSLEDDNSGRLPLASESAEVAGTLSYMAPEMLRRDLGPLSTRTDVYLVGSVLYELLCGDPPHSRPTAMEMVSSVLLSEPTFTVDRPAELIAIIRKAMAREAEDRFASVEDLRQALISFDHHQGSARLTEQALLRLTQLKTALPDCGDNPERREQLYHLFGACRFGFLQALEIWPGNEAAREGLHHAIIAMAEHELANNDDRAAASLLAEIDGPPQELCTRVASLREQREQQTARFEKLRREHDRTVGLRTRQFIGGAMGLLWTVTPLLSVALGVTTPTHEQNAIVALAMMGVAVAFGVWARESISKTVVNRRIALTVLMMLAAHPVLILGAYLLGVTAPQAAILFIFLWFFAASMIAIVVEKRLWSSAVVMMLGFLAAAAWPMGRPYISALCNLWITVNVILVWKPKAAPNVP